MDAVEQDFNRQYGWLAEGDPDFYQGNLAIFREARGLGFNDIASYTRAKELGAVGPSIFPLSLGGNDPVLGAKRMAQRERDAGAWLNREKKAKRNKKRARDLFKRVHNVVSHPIETAQYVYGKTPWGRAAHISEKKEEIQRQHQFEEMGTYTLH